MPLLIGLPGTTGDRESDFISSASGALKSLRAGRAATAAGDNGALNIWKDDAGNYRIELCRHGRTVASASVSTLKAVAYHVQEWLNEIQ